MRFAAFFILLLSCFGFEVNLEAQYNFNVKRTFSETNHRVVFSSFNPDGNYIITAGMDSSIIIWNADRRTIYRTLSGLEGIPNVAVFTPDNKFVISGGKDNKVSVWDLSTIPPGISEKFEGYKGPIKSLDISFDGKYLATGSGDGAIKIWDLMSKNLVYDLRGHDKNKDINAVAFSPDGTKLASGGKDGFLILWDVKDGIMIGSQLAQKNGISDIAFSPDGNLLASCGYDNNINIWKVPGLNNPVVLKGHKDWIQSINFSPDSKTLISGGRDEYIILWDVATGNLLHKSDKQGQVVISIAFNPVRPDFISACYNSEEIESWALSGFDETKWKKQPSILTIPKITADNKTENQVRMTQEAAADKTLTMQEPAMNNPMIEIFSPLPVQGRIVQDKNSIYLIGRVSDPRGINAFLINRAEVKLSDAGIFQFNFNLAKGENLLTLVAINNKGNMVEQKLVVDCTAADASVPGSEVLPEIAKGKYFALLIGINDYQRDEITDLQNPIKDAESLCNVLLSRYTFEKENIIFLKNPTLGEIIMTLEDLGRKLTNNDNLLIFYAGHGNWDEKSKVGYWLPADATKGSSAYWFRNSTLRELIGGIQTRHTLLIADACFSGSIFKSRAAFTDSPHGIQKLYELPSRKAITSGILQEVPDESVFIKYLVESLEKNKDQFLPSEVLFSNFKGAVMNNSSNVPQYGVIQNVDDQGGDFIFIRR